LLLLPRRFNWRSDTWTSQTHSQLRQACRAVHDESVPHFPADRREAGTDRHVPIVESLGAVAFNRMKNGSEALAL
jgi:hypothetical protein